MSHPPECEINIADDGRPGRKCGRVVYEPLGPGSARKVKTRQGRKIWCCDRCYAKATQHQRLVMKKRRRSPDSPSASASLPHRNSLCPCMSGLKFKKCCKLKS